MPAVKVPVPRVVEPFLNVTLPVGVPPLEVTVAVKVTAWPDFDGLRDEVSEVEVLALFTVCVSTAEVLPEKLALPPYTAVMECDPTARVEVANVAFPPASVPVPKVFTPFLKVTVPVGVPPVDVTVAVNVTLAPNVEGFSDEATEVELVATFTV